MSTFEPTSADDVADVLLEQNEAVQQPRRWRRILLGALGTMAVVALALGLVSRVRPIGLKVGPYWVTTEGYTIVDTKGVAQKEGAYTTYTCVNGKNAAVQGSDPYTQQLDGTNCDSCFPGQAEVTVLDKGLTKISSLHIGDRVLVESSAGKLIYEPVLSFIHSGHVGKQVEFLNIQHATGTIRVSANHVLFVATNFGREDKAAERITEGDELFVVDAGTSQPVASRVLSVTREFGDQGMYAPLTPSGKIVVDQIVASNYATLHGMHFGHEASHAAFFPLRAYHKLGFSSLLPSSSEQSKSPETFELHPLAAFYVNAAMKTLSLVMP